MRQFDSPEALLDCAGERFGPTPWITIDQARIDRFGDATDDHQWIHTDVARAEEGPFGATIAHGYLTLSMFSAFLPDLFVVDHIAMSVNVGLNRVRFLSPVRAGSALRASAVLKSAERKAEAVQIILEVVVEIQDSAERACVLEPVIRYYPDRAEAGL